MKIRLVRTEDIPAILAIYAWYIENTTISFELEMPSLETFSNRIEKYSSEAPWLVAVKEDEIIGFAYASPHRGRAAYQWNREVSIYFSAVYHGKGLAQQLYRILFDLLRLQGYTNLLAGIVSPNPKSSKFHQKMGFQLVGTYQNIGFKFGQWHSVSWYELFIQDSNYQPSTIMSMTELTQRSEFKTLLAIS